MKPLILTLLVALGLVFGIRSSVAVTNIFVEAESGVFMHPMTNYLASQASGGRYVWIPPAPRHTIKDGKAEYDVEIPTSASTNDYVIWCRVRAPNFNQDSFLVSVAVGDVEIYTNEIYDVAGEPPMPSNGWQ